MKKYRPPYALGQSAKLVELWEHKARAGTARQKVRSVALTGVCRLRGETMALQER